MRAVVMLVLVACGTDHGALSPDGGGTCSSGGARVSFAHDVQPLVGGCGSEECHGGLISGPTWPYASLVNQPASECTDGRVLVAPGDPAHSYLVQKLDGVDTCSGVRMPRFGTPLPAADVATIAT